MRCSPKLCIGLLALGISGAALFAYSSNAQAAYLLSLLPFLACPLMCVVMMTGHKCDDGKCHTEGKQSASPQHHAGKL